MGGGDDGVLKSEHCTRTAHNTVLTWVYTVEKTTFSVIYMDGNGAPSGGNLWYVVYFS